MNEPRAILATCARTPGCTWTGRYTTPGYARKAHDLHACDRDWTPKNCTHNTRHQHGTKAAYTHCGCRCVECRVATAESETVSRRARAYGRSRLVDATPARDHVTALLDQGIGWPRIAELAGVDGSVVIRLVWGKSRRGRREVTQRVTRDTEAALLAVTYDPADGGPAIDGESTARRLRALVALGWWPMELARRTGWHQSYIDRLIRGGGRRGVVRPGTARRVYAVYLQLAVQRPPVGVYSDRARAVARAAGWARPMVVGGRVLAGLPIDNRTAA
jgi:hypothetical protein